MATLLQRQFSNRAYWQKREREAREKYLLTEAQELAEIESIYREMYQWCEDEINRFYGKYAGLEGIDITDAMKKVTSLDIEQYQELAKKYVAEAQQYRADHGARKTFSAQADAEMRLYNATMRINRLELLKARIGARMVAGTDNLDVYCGDKMTERAIEEYTRLAGILGEDVANIDTALRAKQIVNASFKNATYSQRIWSHQDRLRSAISIELQKGLIAGIGSRQMATNIRKQFDVSRKDAERLMATELRRVQTDVAMDAYKAEGITQYEYMAVNPNACPICKSLNGKIYEVKGAEVGNPDHPLPPMHPRCHCTTAPHIDEKEYNAWLNFLDNGGISEEWEKRQNDTKTVAIPSNDGIITAGGQGESDAVRIPDPITRARVMREAIEAKDTVYSEDLRAAYSTITKDPVLYDIVVHGTPEYVEYDNKFKIGAETLAYIISGRRDYKGHDIRLVSCDAGRENERGYCIAQELANLLGVTVYAADDVVNVGYDGRLTVGRGRKPFDDVKKTFTPK